MRTKYKKKKNQILKGLPEKIRCFKIFEKINKIINYVLTITFHGFFPFPLHFPCHNSTLVTWNHDFWAFDGNLVIFETF